MVHNSTLVLALCLVVLALGSVANAAISNTMTVRMALADTGDAPMGGSCNGCDTGNGENGYTCDFGCVIALTATLSETASSWPVGTIEPVRSTGSTCLGCTGPPDKSPPKPLS